MMQRKYPLPNSGFPLFSLDKARDEWNQCEWDKMPPGKTWKCKVCNALRWTHPWDGGTFHIAAKRLRKEWPDAIHVAIGYGPIFSERVIEEFERRCFTGYRVVPVRWSGKAEYSNAPDVVPNYYGIEASGSCAVDTSVYHAGKPARICDGCGRAMGYCLEKLWRFREETWSGDDFVLPKPVWQSGFVVTKRVVACVVESGWTNFRIGLRVPQVSERVGTNLTAGWYERIQTEQRERIKQMTGEYPKD